MCKEKRRVVVFEVERRTAIIHDAHEGIGDNSWQLIVAVNFWTIFLSWHDWRHQGIHWSIPAPNKVMKQIGITLCTLPEVDGFKRLIVCINYFFKMVWSKGCKRQKCTHNCKGFVRNYLSTWLNNNTDQWSREGVCKWILREPSWNDRYPATNYLCVSSSV